LLKEMSIVNTVITITTIAKIVLLLYVIGEIDRI
jgi:hypothetical protein